MNSTLDYYNKNAMGFCDNTINANMENLYELFLSYIQQGGRILDLGCGSGRDTKAFIDRGYNVQAIDGSEELCKIASQYTGQPVLCKLFRDLDYSNEFDGIWACSSLLHLSKAELSGVFEKMIRALYSVGYIYMSFKYGDFSGERNGRFFTDINEEGLNELLTNYSNLKIIELKITGDVRVGREQEKWLNVLLKKE
jgi:2-polyprenyl-3-methyl-5-hydroxy-6-metoxy-1,4-benzoquinol methylase